MDLHPGHFVAIFGGACAGSEAAFQLAQQGIYVVVFEQQALPHGKIEDGLPKWHVKLRNKEEEKINQKLSHPNIFYLPNTKLGRDIQFEELLRDWGFSAIVLASGAWRDRPLPVEGIERFLGKGFYYQNPFVEWFNHNHEREYQGHDYQVADGAIVVGGGLASIDVVKILMLETTVGALADRGIKTDVISLEHKGIPQYLEELGISFSELGLKGCTLFYRRRDIDMPLGPLPVNPTPERLAKVQQVRQKILKNARAKYLFHFRSCCKPVDKIVEHDRVVGLIFQKTRIIEGRVVPIPDSEFEVHSPLTISSIGSIPEPALGIPMKGELFVIPDENTGKLQGFDNVFAVGNAVTGRGNIRESEQHARKVVPYLMEEFLNWRKEHYQSARAQNWSNLQELGARHVLSMEHIQAIINRITELQARVNYHGNYQKWLEAHRPERLEDMLTEQQ